MSRHAERHGGAWLGWTVCAVAVFAACGSQSDHQAVEDRIRGQVERQIGKKLAELHCPHGSGRLEAGTVCEARLESGEKVNVEVVGSGLAGGLELRIEGESPGERLALRITDSLTARYGSEFVTTSCPRVPVRKGTTFECTSTLRDGGKLPVIAQWVDDRGRYEFADKGVIVLDEVESAIAAQLSAAKTPGKVDCPGTILPSEPDAKFDCTIAYEDGKTGYAVVSIGGWDGVISWELE